MTQYRKLFGIDKGMRSTFLRYDPCVVGPKCSIKCEDCIVSLISDRFLGEKFVDEVLSKKYEKTRGLFTYVLIADAIGCNLNCWFCYAWKFLNLEDSRGCILNFLSPTELARQFACKIRKTTDLAYMKKQVRLKTAFDKSEREKILKHLKKELPFSRIRISGGEPIFSNSEVFQSGQGQNLLEATVKYWADFFEELDKLIGQIKKEGLIHTATYDSDWQKLKHPVWLTEVNGRVVVRFDTNGILFGSEKLAKLFYSKLFGLFKKGKLENINIQIDYSFKGATTKEFMWSQSKQLPTTPENNDKEIDLKTHPQVRGYKNIIFNIKKFSKKDANFKNCVSITVEKGIAHDGERKLWLYYPNSLNWKHLADKLKFEFSDVTNCFDLNFGWNLSGKIHRYSKKGAIIELTDGIEKIDTTSASIPNLRNFRRENIDKEGYMTLVYPTGKKVELPKEPRVKPTVVAQIPIFDQNFWIITGSEENLRVGIGNNLWGVKKSGEGLWENLKEGDLFFFYCTRPISGIVGYGKVTGRHKDDAPFWPNEDPKNKSKYPLRIRFQKLYLEKDWQKGRKSIYGVGVTYYRGLNYINPNKKRVILEKLGISKIS